MIGTGWRAEFYHRIAKEMPDLFHIGAVLGHTEESAKKFSAKTGLFATADPDRAMETNPDFAVLCIPPDARMPYLMKLAQSKIPILCETPAGKTIGELNELWTLKQTYGASVQVCEQYFLQAWNYAVMAVIRQGLLGDISNVRLSAMHGCHAASIMRRILGIGFENCMITGRQFHFDVTATDSRSGYDDSGRILPVLRETGCLQFDNGKAAFYDFSQEQYFSTIRARSLNVQGSRGEINNWTVSYLNKQNQTVTQDMHRIDSGVYGISGWSHTGIMFREDYLYRNPFPGARLNDDELAVADYLFCMKQGLDAGTECYPLREALQDAYLAIKMQEAFISSRCLKTEHQVWAAI